MLKYSGQLSGYEASALNWIKHFSNFTPERHIKNVLKTLRTRVRVFAEKLLLENKNNKR